MHSGIHRIIGPLGVLPYGSFVMDARISRRLLSVFEDVCARWGTLASISSALEDEGFERSMPPDGETPEPFPSTRRETFRSYLDGVDLTEPVAHARALRALETILSFIPRADVSMDGPMEREHVTDALARDGFELAGAGRIVPMGKLALGPPDFQRLRDPDAVLEHLARLQRAGEQDPSQAISSAKALIEAACKLVLEELDEIYDEREDMPGLVRRVQQALKLHPDVLAPTAKGRETIVRVLSNLSQVALGVAELRNEYGADHGRSRSVRGIGPRHANLAVGCASTFCRLLIETLAARRQGIEPEGREVDDSGSSG